MIRFGILSVLVLVCALILGETAVSSQVKVLYVAKNGNDSWSGTLKEPNRAKTDGPFATLEHAQDTIRGIKSSNSESAITVYLRKGTYFLSSTFSLDPRDAGTANAPVTYAAYPGEDVTLSGGKQVTGFKQVEVDGKRMLAADLPEVKDGKWNFNQLFVNGQRRNRSRLPKSGYYQIAGLDIPKDYPWNQGQDKFTFKKGDINPDWRNLNDVDIVALHFWIESRMQIKSVDEAASKAYLNKPSTFRLTDDYQTTGARYFIENVFEALEPGEWYLDRKAGVLYYYPIVGEDTKKAQFIASNLEKLIVISGDTEKKVDTGYINFRNLKFAHTQYILPENSAGSVQAAFQVPAAISLYQAKHCTIENCEIVNIGNYALEIGQGCQSNTIANNRIHDLGVGGIKINHLTEGTMVTDNEIYDGGKIYMSGIGVWIGNSPHNRVLHNTIHDFYYTGVSVGWVWGYGESKAYDNAVEYNAIYNIGRGVLSDLAGVYTLGISPGTRICNNIVHDCYSHSYGGWGLYTDEGSSNILLENNIVYNTKTGGFHQHYGKENILRNNIFAFSKMYQLQRTRMEPHTSFTFEHNIVFFKEGEMLGSNWGDDKYIMDYNLYYYTPNKPISFAGVSFTDWQKRGHDTHSLIANPKFVNPEKFDFTLKADSPALKLGFKQIDISKVGPRGMAGPK